jgi:hypothetical protein
MLRSRKKLGVWVYRPSYRFPCADPSKRRKAKEELAGLKKGRRLAILCC